MIRAALRRLLGLVVLAGGVTAAGSIALGAATGASVERSLALGFYAVGSFLLIAGFFVGNRGPVRVRSESPGAGFAFFAMFGSRRLGWATRDEQEEAISHSALFIVLGFVLVFIGVAFDNGHRLF
jgi:hypothetical protein